MVLGRRRHDRERRGTPADLLVVGLGNPGPRYAGTRHNVGAEAVARLAERHDVALAATRYAPATVAELRLDGGLVVLAVPTTYMNESGQAAGALCRRYGIDDPARLVVVHDELDLPPGRLKVKLGGGLAGNNGLRSVRDHLHTTDFVRVRIGVGKPGGGAGRGADHVLSRPPPAERQALDDAIGAAADAVELIHREGPQAAMTRVNGMGR